MCPQQPADSQAEGWPWPSVYLQGLQLSMLTSHTRRSRASQCTHNSHASHCLFLGEEPASPTSAHSCASVTTEGCTHPWQGHQKSTCPWYLGCTDLLGTSVHLLNKDLLLRPADTTDKTNTQKETQRVQSEAKKYVPGWEQDRTPEK